MSGVLPRDSFAADEGRPLISALADGENDVEDSFHLSGSSSESSGSNLWLNFNRVSSRYSSLSLSPDCPVTNPVRIQPVPPPLPPTGLKRVLEEEEEEEGGEERAISLSVNAKPDNSCLQCIKQFPKRFKSAQSHRKCPHTFRICLVFFMFILLGIAERGSFVILFYLLNSHFYLKPGETITLYFAVRFFIYVMYPVTGFLADAVYGHHKVIRGGLCIAWLGSAFLAIGFATYDSMDHNHCLPTGHCWPVPTRIIVGVGYAIFGAGLTGIRVNLIPFGADQLPDASGGELSSYFHWYYFCITLGHFAAVLFLPVLFKYGSFAYFFLAISIAITLFLSTFLLFHRQWLILPRKGNSITLVYNVVRSSLFSQRPMKKSAFDVGMPKPSWMDKAMIKYGGTYTLEQVEAVKTFFRILLIVLTCIGYYAVFSQLQSTTVMQSYRMTSRWVNNCSFKQHEHLQKHANGSNFRCENSEIIPALLFGAANLFPLLLFMPFYDRIIYTWLSGWKWFSMLARMAWGNFFIVVSILSAIAIEVVRVEVLSSKLRDNGTVTINAFSFREGVTSYEVASPLHNVYLAIPFFFFAFAEVFSNITAVEFIYAQSPSNMKGLLIGMLFASEGLAMGISSLVTLIISKSAPAYHFCSFFGNTRDFYTQVLDAGSKCKERLHTSLYGCTDGILFAYLILAVIAVVFAVLFGVGASMYKPRRRDQDPYMPIWLMEDQEETRIKYMLRKCCC